MYRFIIGSVLLLLPVTRSTCGLPFKNDTLAYLEPDGVTKIAAANAIDCCTACEQAGISCSTWSWSGSKWTPKTPCHLSPYAPINTTFNPGSGYASGGLPPINGGKYTIRSLTGAKQTIWGIGFEIQSDSIGSHNDGMPGGGTLVSDDNYTTSSAPHELVDDEKVRFAVDMLQGFRWCRLALGLFLRGLDAEKKQIIGRWPSQMHELKQMQDLSGIEGFAPEYWSPPPEWKSTKSYYTGSISSSTNTTFLRAFAESRVKDIQYLIDAGLNVPWWGLQNEPTFKDEWLTPKDCLNHSDTFMLESVKDHNRERSDYSRCGYSQCSYYRTFKAVAPLIKKSFPGIKIHANSARGQAGASPVAADTNTSEHVDAWTWHFVGGDRNIPLTKNATFWKGTYGKPIINNEYEYQPNSKLSGQPKSTLNTAQLIMNFFTFSDSPAFYWIHALKPTTNAESKGYGLGFWRPLTDNNRTHFPNLPNKHWTYNPINWHAVAGFAKHIPWDSVRYDVNEDSVRTDARIFAFKTPKNTMNGIGGPLHAYKTPGNRLGIVLAYGRDSKENFTYQITIDDGLEHKFNGHRYTPDTNGYNISIGDILVPAGGSVNITLLPLTIEFWLEY